MMKKKLKELQNNYTTLKESEELLELGVPAESADCHFALVDTDSVDEPYYYRFLGKPSLIAKEIPSWSVGRLIEIISICYDHPKCSLVYDLGDLMSVEDIINETIKPSLEDGMLNFSKLEEPKCDCDDCDCGECYDCGECHGCYCE